MKTEVSERSSGTPQFTSSPLGDVEKVPLCQEVLQLIHLEKPLAFQDHTCHVDLGINVQRNTLPFVETQEIAVQVRAFQGKHGPVRVRSQIYVEKVDDLWIHLVPPRALLMSCT
jgi:hypothetical protein